MDRIDLYLQWGTNETYCNTPEEEELLNKFVALYTMAKAAQEQHIEANPANLSKWRKAYLGTLNALNKDTGEESERKSRNLCKLVYELVESKIDNSVPMPKIMPRHKADLYLVDKTESYIKYEADKILTKYVNDRSERSTYIDGTTWYKVWWDSLDNTHERSGDVKIEMRLVDQVIPQPGVLDYKKLEYVFERQNISITRIYDVYGRLVTPVSRDTNVVPVVSCYYLNENRVVGLFMWTEQTRQVICNEHDWQIRKLRKCKKCHTVVPQSDVCPVCGSKSFKYENATEEVLAEDIVEVYNPYEVGETEDEARKNEYSVRPFLSKGTVIPFYQVKQLPFVPRPAISSLDSIYGQSEVAITLDMQDMTNKLLTKVVDKVLKSGSVVTKPRRMKIGDMDETVKVFGIDSAEEATMVQAKQILSDVSQEIVIMQDLYDNAKSASGVTDSFQGKKDTTATSGKAKQWAAAQSAGRIESLRVMKAAAFAGVYELILKYLLAFSDEPRKFVKVLPDGREQEEQWNKYMFLAKDKYGQIYYRDDFEFSTDPASTLAQDRVSMWQEIQDKFINGALGNPAESRTIELYWRMLEQLQYPLARTAIAGIKNNTQHLPEQVEKALLSNPQVLQTAMSLLQGNTDQRGGARPNSGPAGNGATHAANVDRTNERNRSQNRETVASAQQGGGLNAST